MRARRISSKRRTSDDLRTSAEKWMMGMLLSMSHIFNRSEHSKVRTSRTDAQPEGWGDPDASEAKIIEKIVLLCLGPHCRGYTFSIGAVLILAFG